MSGVSSSAPALASGPGSGFAPVLHPRSRQVRCPRSDAQVQRFHLGQILALREFHVTTLAVAIRIVDEPLLPTGNTELSLVVFGFHP